MLQPKDNQPIPRAFEECSVAVCMASNQAYLPYAAVTISSMLRHGKPDSQYDILLMSKDMTKEGEHALELLAKDNPNASVRVVDMKEWDSRFAAQVSSYYSVETNYRLLILSELFAQYERVLYIDCDVVVMQDILQLAETDMQGYPLAACRDYSMAVKQNAKGAVFFNNIPYTVENYCREILGLEGYEGYFNAGVTMFDTACCRQLGMDVRTASQMLHEKNYFYNDQDVLNILFEHHVCYLDVKWNYIHDYEKYMSYPAAVQSNLYQKVHREKPAIVHYVGGKKPWNYAPVPLEHLFWQEVKHLEADVPFWSGRYPKPERQKQVKASALVCSTRRRK